MRAASLAQAKATNEVAYDGHILVVEDIEWQHESRAPLTMTLRPSSYFIRRAILENLTDDLERKYWIDPMVPRKTQLPLILSASLHIIAAKGRPYLVIAKRAADVGFYPGHFASAVSAVAEADSDTIGPETTRIYDLIRTMWRELDEERELFLGLEEFRAQVTIAALTFDYKGYEYDVVAAVRLGDRQADRICQRESRHKEVAYYDKLRFPSSRGDKEAFGEIAQHLLDNAWVPAHAIGLIAYLHDRFATERDYIDELFY